MNGMEVKREKMESVKYGQDMKHATLTGSLVVQLNSRPDDTFKE